MINSKIPLIYESEGFVAVDKPALMLTVPSRMGRLDPRPALGILLQNQLNITLYPVHRLDYEVSGVVVFAKTKGAQRLFSEALERHEILKKYQAIAENPPTPSPILHESLPFSTVFQCLLAEGKKRSFEAPHGLPSETQVTLLRRENDRAYFEAFPITGRRHQIRFHFSRFFAPILGDERYGAKLPWQNPGIALRAVEISFPEKISVPFLF